MIIIVMDEHGEEAYRYDTNDLPERRVCENTYALSLVNPPRWRKMWDAPRRWHS